MSLSGSSRHQIYRTMYDPEGRVIGVNGTLVGRTMNDPKGQAPSRTEKVEFDTVDLSNVEFVQRSAINVPKIHPEVQKLLKFYTVTFYDQSIRTMAVMNGPTCPESHALQLQLLHHAFTHPDGIFLRWSYLRRLSSYSVKAAALMGRCKRDLQLCAALVCCQAAAGDPSNGYFMCPSAPRCRNWSETDDGRERYDRARTAASIIEMQIHFAHDSAFNGIITAEKIMEFDVYGTLGRLRKQLCQHGIVSEYGEGVSSPSDILDGVYLPTFLFLDSILKNKYWRNLLPRDKMWICQDEMDLYKKNVRL
jgi:hypothetical protein